MKTRIWSKGVPIAARRTDIAGLLSPILAEGHTNIASVRDMLKQTRDFPSQIDELGVINTNGMIQAQSPSLRVSEVIIPDTIQDCQQPLE